MSVASLGMYDAPELRAANDALWRAIAGRLRDRGLRDVPDGLDRSRPLAAIWNDPGLLLGHCCGYPLATRYRARLRPVATPLYGVTGCEGSRYRSRIIVRVDDPAERLADLRGGRAAINDPESNSGTNLFRAALAPLAGGAPFFGQVIETGAHVASVAAVAAGQADVAAIDVVTFAYIARADPALAARVRTLAWTPDSPGLPLVTAIGTPDPVVAQLVAALAEVAADPALAAVRRTLLIDGYEVVPRARYDALLTLERQAARAGYPLLA